MPPAREELLSLNAPAEILPLFPVAVMLTVDLVLFKRGTKIAFVLLPFFLNFGDLVYLK